MTVLSEHRVYVSKFLTMNHISYSLEMVYVKFLLYLVCAKAPPVA